MDNQAMMISLPSLNWRRGLRRFWLLATLGVWIGLGTLQLPDLLTAPRVVIETDQVQKLRKLLEQYRQNALPDAVRDEVRSKLERGELTAGIRYNITATVAGVEQRASYPAEMEEGQVRTAANQWAASLSRNAWIKLAVMALAMPLAFIILTKLIAWGIRGFDDAASPTSAASSPSSGSTPPQRIASPPPRTTPQNTPSNETGGYRAKVVPPLTTPTTTAAPDANTPAAPTPLKPQQYQLMTDQPPAESHKESGQQEPTLGSSSRRQSTTKPASIKLEI